MSDPMTNVIATALSAAGITYTVESTGFYIPTERVHIETRRSDTPRMAKSDNVIVVQGLWAAVLLANAIKGEL